MEDLDQIRASHILIKSILSSNPFDRVRDLKITRSHESALKRIIEVHKQLMGNISLFGKLAMKYSECGSSRLGGDLGYFRKGMMDPRFEIVAFSLKVGELSNPIESGAGWHLILRTE